MRSRGRYSLGGSGNSGTDKSEKLEKRQKHEKRQNRRMHENRRMYESHVKSGNHRKHGKSPKTASMQSRVNAASIHCVAFACAQAVRERLAGRRHPCRA